MKTVESITDGVVENIQKSCSTAEITAILQNITSAIGFEFFTYARLFPQAMTRVEMLIMGNYPDAWRAEYLENEYHFIDPVMKHCTSSALPYFWKDIFTSKNQDAINFSKACSRFGLKEGFTIGIKGNFGDYSVLSLGGSQSTNNLSVNLEQALLLCI